MSECRNLKVVDVRETLDSKLAYLPGGRDREGKPILVVDVPIYSSDESVADNKLEKLLAYLLSTFNDETKKNGISLIMDARKGSWRVARSYIQRSMNVVGKYAARMIVIRPDSFWEKRVDNCTKSWKDGEPIYISITRLYSYVDTAQVSCDLGGTKAYDHYDWIQMRVVTKLKDFGKIDETNDEEKSVEFYVENRDELEVMCRYILHEGRILASDMSSETSQDIQDTIHRIHDLLDMIESNQIDVENSWIEMTTNLTLMKEIKDIEQEHCLIESLKAQKDFMDFVCRGYATRLERRRNILITCQRFFRLVSEYFDKTSEVFDKMIMGNRACNSFEAEAKLMHLEASQLNLDGILQDLIREGEKFSELMSMPVKNALGRDVKVEYAEDITNVTDILDATNARKNIFNDSVELQKLTLKQTISICTYETDADQSIKWLSDLFNVLIKNYTEVGCNITEIQKQKDDLQNFEEISQGAFEYGCQLLNGARILRTSCRLSLDTNASLFSQLREAWRRIKSHCRRLTDLIKIANNSLYLINQNKSASEDALSDHSSSSESLKEVTENREKLLVYIDRTVKLGRLLTTINASETEEINTEEYTTATECSLTPVARSRSESFVTISECDDIISDLYRVEGVGNLEYQVVDGLVMFETSGLVDQLKKMSKSPELIVDINQNVPDVKKTNATSIIETVEETSGKVVKEVTEVTTLRVSHDTKFGVASYKLTSNTLTENKEHKNAAGILNASHQYINGCYNGVHHDDKDASAQHSREEISISEADIPPKLENGHACRHSKIVKESMGEYKLKLPPDELKNVRFLDTKGNNDSGIEMPSKHNERLETSEEEEEENDDNNEYFEKLKMVSCTQVVTDNQPVILHGLQCEN
ncbi:hypothetical protein G9C98_006518 [Cotesia typhae]|uniref:CRAL-TRIO domain-containing protein n=1 Tax=Cotesia typhae TaxID=2053667 RepID=A0A8J5URR9_9HYME|nr:hypothetical protein G9C98_006518 [Cotesia typhae]